jgi:hypothetical protein
VLYCGGKALFEEKRKEEHYPTAPVMSAHHLVQSPSLGDVPFLIAVLSFVQKQESWLAYTPSRYDLFVKRK